VADGLEIGAGVAWRTLSKLDMLMYQASRFAAALFLQRDWLVVDEGFHVGGLETTNGNL
jgi:hypothetical protein